MLLASVEYMELYSIFPFLSKGVKLSPYVVTDNAVTGSFFTSGEEFALHITSNTFAQSAALSISTHRGLGKSKLYSAYALPSIFMSSLNTIALVPVVPISIPIKLIKPPFYFGKLIGNKIIGLTIHNVEEAKEAQELGADYLGISPIFETETKQDAGPAAGLKLIEDVKKAVNLPLVAIGGINLENINEVIKAGADSAAVISAIVTTDDVEEECKNFINKFK